MTTLTPSQQNRIERDRQFHSIEQLAKIHKCQPYDVKRLFVERGWSIPKESIIAAPYYAPSILNNGII